MQTRHSEKINSVLFHDRNSTNWIEVKAFVSRSVVVVNFVENKHGNDEQYDEKVFDFFRRLQFDFQLSEDWFQFSIGNYFSNLNRNAGKWRAAFFSFFEPCLSGILYYVYFGCFEIKSSKTRIFSFCIFMRLGSAMCECKDIFIWFKYAKREHRTIL